MKKKYVFLTSFILLIISGFLVGHVYYKSKQLQEVRKAMLDELSTKYGKSFIVSNLSYGKALGNKTGTYTADVYPKGEKSLEFQVHLSESGKILDESYKEMIWRREAIKSWEPFMRKLGITSYAVNIHIPEEIEEQYGVEDSYNDILKKHKHIMSEYLFIGQIEKDFDKKKEILKVKEITNHILRRELQDFSIEWRYYENGSKNADVFEMRKTTPSYSWHFSKKDVLKGATEENLDRFFIQHKKETSPTR
ncbi:hypothetical protein [Neobacillus kokaensis]|uniref:Uncharacterized protein n=1 Tax=Neobacillus kokaensis TaxID=2759023 RepID=A0ABQ3NAW7_9BACI|nr:hypothetical protein [Neobacillus kokaensis]GHI00962.1 hypothetical protein AM1BK_45040 [Neobacillus kokaensis]